MTRYVLLFSACIALILTGCTKNESTLPEDSLQNNSDVRTATTASSAKGTVADIHWQGSYDDLSETGGDPDVQPDDMMFIHNGVARISNPYTGGFTHLSLALPSDRNIPGDSLVCQTSVTNPASSAGNSPYDVIISLAGSLHSLTVHLVGDSAGLSQTSFAVGDQVRTAIPKLVTGFSNFVVIKVVTKKGQAGVYLNGKLAFSLVYTTANKLGRITNIVISGKGSPATDYVKFINSVTNKKMMTEDFNTEGNSHVVFY